MKTRIIKETWNGVVKYHPEVYIKCIFLERLLSFGLCKYHWKRVASGYDGNGYCNSILDAQEYLESYKVKQQPLKIEIAEEKEL